METTLTVHSRWPRGMCRDHTSMEKVAGAFAVAKLARYCRSMNVTCDAASIWVRCVEKEFHESRNRVPSFLLQLRWRSERIMSWGRFLCGSYKFLESSLRNGSR